MPEHRIQLRRIWAAQVGTELRTVDLPATWTCEAVPHQLTRKFHSPRLRDPAESVFLVLEDVPGLVAASLNGQDLGVPSRTDAWEVPLVGRLGAVNALMLLLNPLEVPDRREWGRIALVIRS